MLPGNKNTKNKIDQFLTVLKDLIFPTFCLGCNVEGQWLCQSCFLKIVINKKLICPVCGQSSFFGKCHKECKSKSYLDGLWTASLYKDDLIKKIIRKYKYQGIKDLSNALSDLLINCLNLLHSQNVEIIEKIDIITFVPLHKRKFLKRGFNQTKILAEKVGQSYKWPTSKLLIRTRFTQTQTKLEREQRRQNISDVFIANNNYKIKNKIILIVDDVSTTGATLQECAKILKQAGAKQVWGIAIAQD